MRTDAVRRETRWASVAIVAVLVPALFVLWGMPGDTAGLWAWPIKPDLTPILMGSGYGAGAYFFTRVALARAWHTVSAGVLSAAFFATVMLVVTLLHWDRFNGGDAPFWAAFAFYGWVVVYVTAPPVVGGLWLLNRRTVPGRTEQGELLVAAFVRRAARGLAALLGATAVVLLLRPSLALEHAPWALTPLTARTVAGFTAQVAFGALLVSLDARWSAWRILVQTFLVASALLLVGVARAWGDLETGRASAWLFVLGLTALATAILWLYVSYERQRTSGRAAEHRGAATAPSLPDA